MSFTAKMMQFCLLVGLCHISIVILADPNHGPEGGFALTTITIKHNMRLWNHSIHSRECSCTIFWPHFMFVALPCYCLSGPNFIVG